MIRLSNGATVHAAYVVPAEPSTKPHGIVLAETKTDWVVWDIYWDGQTIEDYPDNSIIHEVWESTNGHYFSKNNAGNLTDMDPRRMAYTQFGLNLRRFAHDYIRNGMRTPL